ARKDEKVGQIIIALDLLVRDPAGKDDGILQAELRCQIVQAGLLRATAGEENGDFRLVSPQLRKGTQEHVQSLVKIERSKKTDDVPPEQTEPGSEVAVGRTGPGEGEAVDRVWH